MKKKRSDPGTPSGIKFAKIIVRNRKRFPKFLKYHYRKSYFVTDQQEQVPKKISTPVKILQTEEKSSSTTTSGSSSTPAFPFTLNPDSSPLGPSNKRRPSTVLHNNHTKSNCVTGNTHHISYLISRNCRRK